MNKFMTQVALSCILAAMSVATFGMPNQLDDYPALVMSKNDLLTNEPVEDKSDFDFEDGPKNATNTVSTHDHEGNPMQALDTVSEHTNEGSSKNAMNTMSTHQGVYLEIGGSWNTIRNRVTVETINNSTAAILITSYDNYVEWQNKFAPAVSIGYWNHQSPMTYFNHPWLWGLQLTYKYMDFDSSGRGVFLRNTTNSIVQNAANTTMYSKTNLKGELLILAYFGLDFTRSSTYLGLGAAMLSVRNSIISAGFDPGAGAIRPMTNTNFNVSNNMWGWAAQLGYNYYLTSNWFLNVNYTFAQVGQYNFDTSTTRAQVLPGALAANNPTGQIDFNRKLSMYVQEVIFSAGYLFDF